MPKSVNITKQEFVQGRAKYIEYNVSTRNHIRLGIIYQRRLANRVQWVLTDIERWGKWTPAMLRDVADFIDGIAD